MGVGRGLGRDIHEVEGAGRAARRSDSSLEAGVMQFGRGRGRGSANASAGTSPLSGSPGTPGTPGEDGDGNKDLPDRNWVDPNILETAVNKYRELSDQFPKEKQYLMSAGGSRRLAMERWSDHVQNKLLETCKAKGVFGVSKETCLSEGSATHTLALLSYIRFELTKRGVGQCFVVTIRSYMERYLLALKSAFVGSGVSARAVPVDVGNPALAKLYASHDTIATEELLKDMERVKGGKK